nr:MAG TPA: hypothetical protein [Caudoviricetes sp.]
MKENNKKIEICESNLLAAYQVADENGKKLLDALFGQTAKDGKVKPTLDDYKTIKSYEDACEVLEITPILSENREKAMCAKLSDHYDYRQDMPKHIIALMKLEIISRALWGRNFQPKPDGEGSQILWYPWFVLYTQDEVDRMSNEDRGALLAADADTGANAGFGNLNANTRSSYSNAHIGFRLCQETEEKAEYFGKQFIKIWAEYLQFNFTVGDHLK